jgi:hypothetical protein
MNKKVLVLYYTQSGQLADVVNCFVRPLEQAGVTVEKLRIKPVNDFSFPWSSARFFDAMPESVLAKPVELQAIELKETKYDLVVFAYQPWFLSPSIPANSALLHPSIKSILKDTPVITLIAARNMWLNAQQKVKAILKNAGANLVGNIALVDRNGNLTSVVTILHWMLSGKKDKYLGIFPVPGVSETDIEHTSVFGKTVLEFLQPGDWTGLQQTLLTQQAVEINSNLMFVEERAGRLFNIWANLVNNAKNRAAWLVVYKYYLLFALFIVAPVVLTVYSVFFKPFLQKSINHKKLYYSSVEL